MACTLLGMSKSLFRLLTGQQRVDAVAKRAGGKAGGLDTWRTCEVNVLPVPIMKLFVEVFTCIEAGIYWHDGLRAVPRRAYARARAILLCMLGLRGVLTVTWTRVPPAQLREVRKKWLRPCMYGAVRGAHMNDVSVPHPKMAAEHAHDAQLQRCGSLLAASTALTAARMAYVFDGKQQLAYPQQVSDRDSAFFLPDGDPAV